MKDRFDLENEIHMFGLFADDIKTVSNFLMESEGVDDDLLDKAVNALNGISALLEMKTECLMDTMCQVFKLDKYNKQTTSGIPVEIPLTNTDNRVTTSCRGECGRVHHSFGLPID